MTKKKIPLSGLILLCLMYFGFSFHWTIMLNNILPTRVLDFVSKEKQGTYLGSVTTVGALIALITCPLIGIISDRTLSKYGRRKPFLVIGVLLNAFFLLWLTYTHKYFYFLISFVFIQLVTNSASTPYSALLPDKVDEEQLGSASGIMGFFDVFARIIGSFLGGLMMGSVFISEFFVKSSPSFLKPFVEKIFDSNPLVPTIFLIIIIMQILMLITIIFIKEEPIKEKKGLKKNIIYDAFSIDLKGGPSFGWLILSRAFNNLGVYTLVCFLLYYIKDYLKIGDINLANQKMGILMGVVGLTTLPSVLFTGYLLDRFKKRKIFIYISSIIMILVSFTFIMIHNFNFALIVGAVFGFAFGAFCTADWTLALDLLPDKKEAAKNLGVWNYAGVGPQVIAPAIGGILLDKFNLIRENMGYQAVFITVIIYLIIGTLILVKVKEKDNFNTKEF